MLPVKLKRQLHLPRLVGLLCDYAEVARTHSRVGAGKLRVIQGVKRLRAKFEMGTFPKVCKAEFLEKRQCPRSRTRHAYVRQDFRRVANGVISRRNRDLGISKVLI